MPSSTPRDPRTYLHDMLVAAERVERFLSGRTFADYQRDDMLRAAVERQFEIIGEALNQLSRTAPEIAASIPEHRRIIAFRNILIHGYASVDDTLVWGIATTRLAGLRQAISELLARYSDNSDMS